MCSSYTSAAPQLRLRNLDWQKNSSLSFEILIICTKRKLFSPRNCLKLFSFWWVSFCWCHPRGKIAAGRKSKLRFSFLAFTCRFFSSTKRRLCLGWERWKKKTFILAYSSSAFPLFSFRVVRGFFSPRNARSKLNFTSVIVEENWIGTCSQSGRHYYS